MWKKLKFWKQKGNRMQQESQQQLQQIEKSSASIIKTQGSSGSLIVAVPLSQFFNTNYKLVKTEQFDNYMKALGINVMSRKIGLKIVPTLLHLTYENTTKQFTLTTSSMFLNCQVKFKIDQPFQFTTPDGRKCTVTFEYKPPNSLHEMQKGEKLVTVVREFSKDVVHMFLTINKSTCKMTYLHERLVTAKRKLVHATSPVGTILEE